MRHGSHSEHKKGGLRLSTLICACLCCFFIGGLLYAPSTVLRPVFDADGRMVLREDGSLMLEYDLWGNLKAQWPANLMLAVSTLLFVWTSVRILILIWKKVRKPGRAV